MLVDTHCHVHWADFAVPPEEVLTKAKSAEVMHMICVGTNEADSNLAIAFAQAHPEAFATVGLHPHYADNGLDRVTQLARLAVVENKKIVAIGETGLDYYYNNSPKKFQIKALEAQIQLAIDLNLPIIFHVRDGYDDFWPILDNFHGYRGVAHSFTDTIENSEEALKRGLYIGVNGISTFTKINEQQKMYLNLPLDKIVLETDAPFLTPSPLRGKIKCNEPAYTREIAQYMGNSRQIDFGEVERITTQNARALFNF
jgi:TatD DNase family protein